MTSRSLVPFSSQVKSAFKKYQQDSFLTIALSPEDLILADEDDRPDPAARFRPVEMIIKNEWEPATVLLRSVSTPYANIANLDFNWDEVLDDCLHVIKGHADTEHARTSWRDWIASRPRSADDVRQRFMHTLPKPLGDWPRRPVVAPTAQGALSAGAVVVNWPRTVSSSVYGGGEGAQAKQIAADARAHADFKATSSRRDPLTPGTFCFVKFEAINEDGFQIPWLIVELPNTFDGADTTDADLSLKVKWWESSNGKYSGNWKKWCDDDGEQYDGATDRDSCVDRGMIEMIDVKFTMDRPNVQGGFKLNAETKRRLQAAGNMCEWGLYK